MIRKLKRKIIVLALVSLFALLAFIVIGMYWLNYRSVKEEADETLVLISDNSGKFPELLEGWQSWFPVGMSPEVAYESRYFSVVTTSDGVAVSVDTSRIYTVDESVAGVYAQEVLDREADRGFYDEFRYRRVEEGGLTQVTFLDCGRKLDMLHDFIVSSVKMALVGYLVLAVIICIVAGRFVRPVAESYERQKRFITDAGHEIKTPLTIISANADVLEMENGENEYLEEIRRQTRRLGGLTNDLVYLAKMEEAEGRIPMEEFAVSDVVRDTAEPFETLAQTQGKRLNSNIEPSHTMRGNEKAIERVVSILLDNAIKYSPEDSAIQLSFGKQGRRLVLSVSNRSKTPVDEEQIRHVFERFYRMDASRNSETGGHGIGLSMAKAIVEDHGGRITATTVDGASFTVMASFPV